MGTGLDADIVYLIGEVRPESVLQAKVSHAGGRLIDCSGGQSLL